MRKKSNLLLVILWSAGLLWPAIGLRAQSRDFSRSPLDLTKPPYFQELNLSEEQKAQIQKIYDSNKAGFEKARTALHESKARFEQAMETDANDGAVRKAHQSFESARNEMANLGFEQALAIRKVLTPEQRQKFNEIRKEMFEKMRGGTMGSKPDSSPHP